MGLGIKQVSEDDNHQVFDTWLQPTQSPKPFQSNKRSHQQLQRPEPLNCPRCDSTNTKFCYYNNYNKTQPRHFCKACKRHWTKGGTLRNVPVGGGRKNKRQKPSPSTTITTTVTPQISNSYQIMSIQHQPSFVSTDINNALAYNTESFINLLPSDHHKLGFSFWSSNFEANPSSNDFNATCYNKVAENMEESVITSIIPGVDEAWESEVRGSVMELPSSSSSYWNWNDLDTTVPDLTIPNWDIETEINP